MFKQSLLPIHPILLALLPLLLILQQNQLEIGPRQIWRTAVFSLLLTGVIWAVAYGISRDTGYASLLSSLGILLFHAMGRLHSGNVHGTVRGLVIEMGLPANPRLTLILTALLFGLGSAALHGLRRRKKGIAILLNITSASLVTATVFVIGLREWRLQRPLPSLERSSGLSAAANLDADPPAVFIIVLDGYARADVLHDLYSYDNSQFLSQLEQLGFQTVADARSNYMQTSLSLASALNLDYLQNLLGDSGSSQTDRSALLRLIQHNRIETEFQRAGYSDIALSSGYRPTERTRASRYLYPDTAATNLFERLTIENSLLGPVVSMSAAGPDLAHPGYRLHRERIEFAFEYLAQPPSQTAQPTWTFVHILAPHPPFVFDAEGTPLQPQYPYVLLDGSAYPGSMDDYRQQYIEQLEYINQQLLSSLTAIVEENGDDAAIIVHADHGPGSELVWESLADSNARERFGILLSYRLPGGSASLAAPGKSPVNLYRGLINELMGGAHPPLPEKSYFTPWDQPFNFQPVADDRLNATTQE